eukprot:CAMPEP_0205906248 /NCGR_PEP_ID=MMETSP1325-20131115/1839_1 /ASSEMBLY_ACC=CAM_ASM_000708 /TAXON_ID=236786 /ORGANISM="Florenciella sp., Strain RCC1007" /LENGTH=31 /DNA_ID= /DNA_START= /DNA_END= /DNA_ORIENTATION=
MMMAYALIDLYESESQSTEWSASSIVRVPSS